MSDTSKCPKCGGDLFWCENSYPRFAYCTNTDECGYETPSTADKDAGACMTSAALHRIRELEHESRNACGLHRAITEMTRRADPALSQPNLDGLSQDVAAVVLLVHTLNRRIAAKDEALRVLESLGERLTDFDPPGPVTDEQRREDQYGRKIQNVAREALKKCE